MTRIMLMILNSASAPKWLRLWLMKSPRVVPNYEWNVWLSREDQARRDQYSEDFAAWCREAQQERTQQMGSDAP